MQLNSVLRRLMLAISFTAGVSSIGGSWPLDLATASANYICPRHCEIFRYWGVWCGMCVCVVCGYMCVRKKLVGMCVQVKNACPGSRASGHVKLLSASFNCCAGGYDKSTSPLHPLQRLVDLWPIYIYTVLGVNLVERITWLVAQAFLRGC